MSDFFEMIKNEIPKVSKANKRVEVFDEDGIYLDSIYPADRHDSDAEDFKKESKRLKDDNPIILSTDINPPDWQELQAEDEEEMQS